MSILDLDKDEDPLGLNTIPARITIPDVSGMDTTEAALAYAAAGIYVLPVKFKSKSPGSRVGDRWQDKSVIDRQDIVAHWAGTNDGIAIHAGRSGLVIFDVDHPEKIPPALQRAINELHPPHQQSRPDPPGRGHFVFAQPPGRTIGNGPGKLGDAWGQVRGLNGVIIGEPSPHKDADDGAEYEWRRVGPVPVLPNYVADDLPDGSQAEDAATDETVQAFLETHTGTTRPDLLDRLCHVFTGKINGGGSRHTAAVSLLVGALKEARAGYYDARTADARLRGLFTTAVTDGAKPNQRNDRAASREWAGIRAWAIGQANAADLDEIRQRVNDKAPPNVEDLDLSAMTPAAGRTSVPPNVDPATGEINRPPAGPNLPASFYDERPELAHIRQAAYSAARSADAVLGATLTRVAALIPPSLKLPAPVARHGSLDVVAALIANAGDGKSTAVDVSTDLIPIEDPAVSVQPLGSGEGIVEAYFDFVTEDGEDGKKRKVKRQVYRGLLFELDEGQALQEMGSRKGSILMPTIRSAWSGGRLGQANASGDTKRHLKPKTYRFALIAGFQTEKATALLDDAAGGTPQRFLYFDAGDPLIPDEAPPWPGPLNWRLPLHQPGPMGLDADVASEIRTRSLARTRREVVIDPLDAHRDQSRLKASGLLAVLAGRIDITAADWRLAGQVLDASDRVRTGIITAAQYRARMAEDASSARAARRAAHLDDSEASRAIVSMAKAIARHVHRAGCADGCTRSCVTRATAGKHRKLVATIDEPIAEAARRGWVVADEDGAITAGGGQP